MNLAGTTAVVTGAVSGIGRATAIGFADAGANVALLDVDGDGARALADELDPPGARTIACAVDVADPAAVSAALQASHARFGRVDALANVAAIYPRASVLDVTEEMWDRVMAINLRGLFFCCQAALRIMFPQGNGAIVNVASGAAFRALEAQATYSASKSGVVGLSRVLALECARKGVRVNVVAPGHTLTENTIAAIGPERVDGMAESLVPGRFLTPDEPANAIVWLCTDAASGINGAIVNVNGGNYMP